MTFPGKYSTMSSLSVNYQMLARGILFGCPSNIVVPFYFNDINRNMPVIDFQHVGHLYLNIPSHNNHLQQEHLRLPLYWYDPLDLYELVVERAYQHSRYNYGSDIYVHSYYTEDIICNTKDTLSNRSYSWIDNIIMDKETITIDVKETLYDVRENYPYETLKHHLFFLFTHLFNLPNLYRLMDISQFSIGIFPLATHQGTVHLWAYVLIYKETILPTALFYSPLLYSFKDLVLEYSYNIKVMEREIQLYNKSMYVDRLKLESVSREEWYYDLSEHEQYVKLYNEKLRGSNKPKKHGNYNYAAWCSYIWYDNHHTILLDKQHLMPTCFMVVVDDTIFPVNLSIAYPQLSTLCSTHLHYMMTGAYIAKPIYELYQ